MISITIAAAVGAVIGAVALTTVSAMTNGAVGLDIALEHIPSGTRGYSIVSAVRDMLLGGVAGAGAGAGVAAAAKGLSVA